MRHQLGRGHHPRARSPREAARARHASGRAPSRLRSRAASPSPALRDMDRSFPSPASVPRAPLERSSCARGGRGRRARARRARARARASREEEAPLHPRAGLDSILPHQLHHGRALHRVLHQGRVRAEAPVSGERRGGRLFRLIRIRRRVHVHGARRVQGEPAHQARAQVCRQSHHGLLPALPPGAARFRMGICVRG